MQTQDTLLLRSLDNFCQLLWRLLLRDSRHISVLGSAEFRKPFVFPGSAMVYVSVPSPPWKGIFSFPVGLIFVSAQDSLFYRCVSAQDSGRETHSWIITIMPPQAQKSVRRWNWHTQSDPKLVFPGTIMRENLSSPLLARCRRREDVYERKSKSSIAPLADNPRQVAKLHEGPWRENQTWGEAFPGSFKSTWELKPHILGEVVSPTPHGGNCSVGGKWKGENKAQINLSSFSVLYLYLNHPYVFIVSSSEDPKNRLVFFLRITF